MILNHNHTTAHPQKLETIWRSLGKSLPKPEASCGEEQQLGEETSISLPATDGNEDGDFLTLTTRWFASCLR